MASAKITLRKFIAHAIDREYMSGVSREKSRVKATGEVFTPDALVREVLEGLQNSFPDAFTNPARTFEDPTCGDGQILAHVVLYKLIKGDTTKLTDPSFLDRNVTDEYRQALSTITGMDIMLDNVRETKRRLRVGTKSFDAILHQNIICGDALRG